ncbi:MAG: 2-dehydropantoate 2-reductase [Lachnospiraceae bacterium]|nr:2-dehydropantoate 2-reductase [Lachnospiraceae bacterium]MDD3616390.1 2-dehydropantoate 2-reductase [Lachnospiraceae bacterium]
MKRIETVNIIGMGALGMLFGDMIMKHIDSEHVTYVMDKERYERSKDAVYKVNGKPVRFHKCTVEEAKPCDLLITAVKYTGLEAALDTMKTSIDENTTIISVMNGITSEDIIGERYGKDQIIDTVAQGMDAMHFGTNLQYTKAGQLCVGVMDASKQERLDSLTTFFDMCEIPYVIEENIRHRMWGKFMLNVGVNQTCMVYGTDYAGAMKQGSEAVMTLVGAMREVVLLANTEGVDLSEADLKQYINLIKTLSPEATPSMGQDRINKRPSEVELFAGTVMKLAKKHDLPVPANEFLYRRVYEIEAEYSVK